jgi:hypothetical protein
MLFLFLIQVNEIGFLLYPSRKILLPMKANSANSRARFIRRPLRTPEMAEVAKVLVSDQHSHLFTIQPVSIRNKR